MAQRKERKRGSLSPQLLNLLNRQQRALVVGLSIPLSSRTERISLNTRLSETCIEYILAVGFPGRLEFYDGRDEYGQSLYRAAYA